MNKKLKYFCYSQNSINTYKSCPTKFKYKYIDRINWKNTDEESLNYYESLKLGRDFHLMCERYFSNIPIGLNSNVPSEFKHWISKIKKLIPIENEKTYLPEYEVRYSLNGNIIQAKYDLVVIGKNKIDVWDWKTEARKIDYKHVDSRVQTIVYMFLAKEVIPKIQGLNIDADNINMKYYQPKYDEEPVTISYDNHKHENNKNKILSYIDNIKKCSSEDNEYIEKNNKHCKFCEFNKLCNGENIDYRILEGDIYGT